MPFKRGDTFSENWSGEPGYCGVGGMLFGCNDRTDPNWWIYPTIRVYVVVLCVLPCLLPVVIEIARGHFMLKPGNSARFQPCSYWQRLRDTVREDCRAMFAGTRKGIFGKIDELKRAILAKFGCGTPDKEVMNSLDVGFVTDAFRPHSVGCCCD